MHDLNFITTLSVGKRDKPRIKRIEYIWQMIWGTRAEQMGAVQRLWEVSEECYITNGWDKTTNTLKEMAIWVWIKCWNCTPKNNWSSTFKSKDFLNVSVRAFRNNWCQPTPGPRGDATACVTLLDVLLPKNIPLSRRLAKLNVVTFYTHRARILEFAWFF